MKSMKNIKNSYFLSDLKKTLQITFIICVIKSIPHRYSITNKRFILILLVLVLLWWFFVLFAFGAFHHPLEKRIYTDFHYSHDSDIEQLVSMLKNNQTPEIPRTNAHNFYFHKNCDGKCKDMTNLLLVYVVKSKPQHFNRRLAIRHSWGYERRFPDVDIRTVFLIGIKNVIALQISIDEESEKFNDIVQTNYTDTYFNFPIKIMSGFDWAMKYCQIANFYMFIDDDYYVSTKNVVRFLKGPINYPNYLKSPPLRTFNNFTEQRRHSQDTEFELNDGARVYTGFVSQSAPHRNYFSKWYISLNDYPYHTWSPYVSGGVFVVSKAALKDIYYASFYTKPVKYENTYVGILAFKTKIKPFYSEEFHIYKKIYKSADYQYLIASHGYGDPKELIKVWTEQKRLGNA